jgi:hypothetical protein
MFIEFIIDYPFVILLFILIIFLLFFIKRKLYGEEEIESEINHTSEILDQQQILTRRQLAEKTRQYQSGNLSWQELIDFLFDANKQYPEDQLIFDLYDLIEHEPKRGGFLGVSEEEWQRRQRMVTNIINTFEQDSF